MILHILHHCPVHSPEDLDPVGKRNTFLKEIFNDLTVYHLHNQKYKDSLKNLNSFYHKAILLHKLT